MTSILFCIVSSWSWRWSSLFLNMLEWTLSTKQKKKERHWLFKWMMLIGAWTHSQAGTFHWRWIGLLSDALHVKQRTSYSSATLKLKKYAVVKFTYPSQVKCSHRSLVVRQVAECIRYQGSFAQVPRFAEKTIFHVFCSRHTCLKLLVRKLAKLIKHVFMDIRKIFSIWLEAHRKK